MDKIKRGTNFNPLKNEPHLSKQPSFFRKKVEDIIDFVGKNKTLNEIKIFVFDLRSRRPMIKYISKNLNGNLIGAEIGTFEGENAKNMLSHLSIKHIYLIDPYLHYNKFSHSSRESIPHAFDIAQKRLSKFNKKTTYIKKMSEDAVNDISEKLDFIYIDGNHAYKYVKKDIELYYPKIKKGGVIGGHDIWNKEVCKAFMEFSEQNNLRVNIKYPDWWIVKQED